MTAQVARGPATASIQERSTSFTPKVNASFCMARAPWKASGIPRSGEARKQSGASPTILQTWHWKIMMM